MTQASALQQSVQARLVLLKGAMLLVAWLGNMIRPTRDIDLLGFGDLLRGRGDGRRA